MNMTPDRLSFATKRVPCPVCGARHGFAPLNGSPGAGKCHACGEFFPPNSKANDSNDNILRMRTGSTINLNASAKINPGEDGREVPDGHVTRSLDYLIRCNESFNERTAIMENDGGLSRTEAEREAAKELGFAITHPNSPMTKIIEEETTLLRRESAFAATITQLTRPTILSEWHVGLSSDGATIFWYADVNGLFRNGKKIWYEPNGWNRLRDHRHNPHFLYKGNPIPIYGEWQLTTREQRPFALFESEKTAIVASVHLPQYVCLALGGHELKNERKASVLHGRTGIVLFDREPQTIGAAAEAAQTLRRIGANANVENLEHFYPGIPNDWDVADIIYHQYLEWKEQH
jgi:Domain of unknown function (DUF6371)